jgi:hypothetical protein
MSNDWIKCSAVRLQKGKLQLKNPKTSTYGGRSWEKASIFDKLFGEHVIKYTLPKAKKARVVSSRMAIPRAAKAPSLSTLGTDGNDAITALVAQGAKKQQATLAVKAARARGASGFEGLFRGGLKELRP